MIKLLSVIRTGDRGRRFAVIRLVEGTDLTVRATLRQMSAPWSTFYSWYQRYVDQGFDGLDDKKPAPRPRWNAIPEKIQKQILDLALERTDFTYFRIINWGWYYLSTVLDDFSRYIIAWMMGATDVTETLDEAIAMTGVDQVKVKHRPRLLSDNGLAYLSGELRENLVERGMGHTQGSPYHPQMQGKIERYHRTVKNVVKLQHCYFPEELKAALKDFVAHYDNERYHESLDDVAPADVYYGRRYEVLSERSKIKRRKMEQREEYLAQKAA